MGYPEVPVCVKATDGNGSRGVRIVDRPHPDPDRFFNEKPNSAFISLDYLEKTLQGQSLPTLMVMEYLPGDEYSVDVLADQNGVRDIVCRRGLRVVSSIQTECVVERSPALEQACRDITHALGLQGVFGFDLKCRADGSPALMEINPRLTAGIVACAAAGCNLPYRALLLALGEPLPDTHIRYGTLMTRRYQEEFFTADGTPIPSLEEIL